MSGGPELCFLEVSTGRVLELGSKQRRLRGMEVTPLGDCAALVRVGGKSELLALEEVARLAKKLNAARPPGVTDVVPSFATVTVHYDPAKLMAGGRVGAGAVDRVPDEGTDNGPPGNASDDRGAKPVDTKGAATASVFSHVETWIRETSKGGLPGKAKAAREIEVPVSYGGEDGPDLAEVAAKAKLSEAEVIRVHAKGEYRVAAVGFSPGFPYLIGLAPRLAMPRKATPRTAVPAGSVGIGGTHTGVYPTSSPGGWSLIGRTPLRLFRPENEDAPTLLEAGDVVRFRAAKVADAQRLADAGTPEPAPVPKLAKGAAVLEVLRPGSFTTVQDLGRPGWQHLGITVGGAMDRRAARVANWLVGNDERAPLLEITLAGPRLKFLRETWVALTGAGVPGVVDWRPWRVEAGQVVDLGALEGGARAYLAVAGGFEITRVLGGAGTLVRAGIGGWRGRALQAGDVLGAERRELDIQTGWSPSPEFRARTDPEVTVRVVRGPQWDWFSNEARRALLEIAFEITAKSDRMGLRLKGPQLTVTNDAELASEGVGFGSIQVPRDGQPIVLMADRQTIGGYPKIAHVIAVDLPLLAQARSGRLVRFSEVSVGEAHALYLKEEHALALLAAGVRGKIREAAR